MDLTPVLAGTGSARLLDMGPGRSAAALTSWPAAQPPQFRDQVKVVAMDPFHVAALAGTKLDLCCQRVQHQTLGWRAPGE